MKRFLQLILILTLGLFLLLPSKILAVTSLSKIYFDIQPKSAGALSTWTIGFSLPQDSKVGHILISLAGYHPDLSNTKLGVSGLPNGTAKIGKSNLNCVSNCDDIRYYFSAPVDIKAGTDIVFTLSDVKNSNKIGQTGINFINVFSSKYPATDLAFSASDYFVKLVENDSENGLIPESVTNEGHEEIQEIMINELFYQEGSQTTKLSEIKDASNVENLTFDLIDKAKVVFKEPVDLSNEEAVHYIANLADYMTFQHLYFWTDYQLTSFFNVPLELTFYDISFVWEPDILKDNEFVLVEEDIENFHSAVVDDESQISFIIREGGSYRIIPRFELYITDNQKITTESNEAKFSGRISDPTALITISLNGKELKNLEPKIDPETGEFSFSLELTEGANLIEAEAESVYGEVDKITRIINYQPTVEKAIEKEEIFNPVYYIIIILIILAIVLIATIVYLVKKK